MDKRTMLKKLYRGHWEVWCEGEKIGEVYRSGIYWKIVGRNSPKYGRRKDAAWSLVWEYKNCGKYAVVTYGR